MVPQLKEKTIGIVGFGYIGQLVARKLQASTLKSWPSIPM